MIVIRMQITGWGRTWHYICWAWTLQGGYDKAVSTFPGADQIAIEVPRATLQRLRPDLW